MRNDSDYRQDLSKQQAGLLALVSLPCAPSRSHSGFCTGSSITAAAPHRILTCFPLSPTRQNASSGTCCYSILCIYRIIFICLCKSGFPIFSLFSLRKWYNTGSLPSFLHGLRQAPSYNMELWNDRWYTEDCRFRHIQ